MREPSILHFRLCESATFTHISAQHPFPFQTLFLHFSKHFGCPRRTFWRSVAPSEGTLASPGAPSVPFDFPKWVLWLLSCSQSDSQMAPKSVHKRRRHGRFCHMMRNAGRESGLQEINGNLQKHVFPWWWCLSPSGEVAPDQGAFGPAMPELPQVVPTEPRTDRNGAWALRLSLVPARVWARTR